MNTCFALLLGDISIKEQLNQLDGLQGVVANVFFWTFEVLVFLVLLNFLLAIVFDAFCEVKESSFDPKGNFLTRPTFWTILHAQNDDANSGRCLCLICFDIALQRESCAIPIQKLRMSLQAQYTFKVTWHTQDTSAHQTSCHCQYSKFSATSIVSHAVILVVFYLACMRRCAHRAQKHVSQQLAQPDC